MKHRNSRILQKLLQKFKIIYEFTRISGINEKLQRIVLEKYLEDSEKISETSKYYYISSRNFEDIYENPLKSKKPMIKKGMTFLD